MLRCRRHGRPARSGPLPGTDRQRKRSGILRFAL